MSRLGGGGIVQQEGDGRGGGFAEFQEEGGAGSDVERTEEEEVLAGLNFPAFTQLLVWVKVGAIGAEVAYPGA